MIYTVTFNPAIDYVVHLPKLEYGDINRSAREEVFFGGKGVNVSTVLARLGQESTALGFAAGFTGKAIEEGLRESGVKCDFIKIPSGLTRINVKIRSGEETDINGSGPDITEEATDELFAKLDKLSDGDYLILAGSIPSSVPDDIYEKIMEKLDGRGINIAVDATKDLLLNVLRYHPFLIKPNNDELGEMFGVELKTEDEIIEYARKLQEKGARNVLVSMGGDGSILIPEDGGEIIRMGVPKGELVNSVGAGDSMVAGFILGYIKSGDFAEALRLGTACGSATAFSPGLAEKETIESVLKLL